MSIEFLQAEEIATRGLQEKAAQSKRLSHFRFQSPRLHTEYDRCFVFAAPSEEMEEAGYAPAAIFVYVDKNDGHLWNNEEQQEYFDALAKKAERELIAA